MTNQEFQQIYESLSEPTKSTFRGMVRKECQLNYQQFFYRCKGITKLNVLEVPIIEKIIKTLKIK